MSRAAADIFAQFAAPVPTMLAYHVLVKPRPPKVQKGSIVLATRTKNAEQAVCTVGQITAMGELAWKSKTAGLDYSADKVAAGMKVGDWVVYRSHSGQRIKMTQNAAPEFVGDAPADDFMLIMSDTDILARIDPKDLDRYYDWL
jgi:co-chaperonin GroES (HSP10)